MALPTQSSSANTSTSATTNNPLAGTTLSTYATPTNLATGSGTPSSSASNATTTNVYQNTIPPELMPYAMEGLGSLSNLIFNGPGYQPYTGQQVAGFSPEQTQAFQNIQQMQPSAYTGQAANLAGMAGTNQFTGANVNQYMSPYVNDVIAQQQQGAIRGYAQQLPGMAGVATQAGGLGGSREALVNAMGQQGLEQQLQNIQATGLQNAFQNAQGQFNTANQNQLAAAGALGNLGMQDYTQNAGINTALLGAGALQQGQEQNVFNNSMQNYYNALNFPYQQLNNLMGAINKVPVAQSASTMYAAPANATAIGANLLTGLGSFFGPSG